MASPELEKLLEVQEHDIALDQLRHRRATLPARDELTAVEAKLAELATTLVDAQQRRDAVARRQSDLEGELRALEARVVEIEGKMYGGTISASRELQAMAGEVDSLKKRRSTLEDHILEAMDEREPIDAEVGQLEDAQVEATDQADGLRSQIIAAEAELGVDETRELDARAGLVATVPAPLLEQYERIRSHSGGIGAARLVGASCSGCHLSLPAVEVDKLKRAGPDEVILCDQCGRILVR
jgi:predicted  nucleic acid-binding Zn-ribbon protein